jgi:hypothetical protein
MQTSGARIVALGVAALMLMVVGVSAQEVIKPTAVIASSSLDTGSAPIGIIDRDGMVAAGGAGEADDRHNTGDNAWTMWLSARSDTDGDESEQYLIFDLGSRINVSAALIWNFNMSTASGFTDLGVKTMDISATATGTSVNDATGFTGTTSVSLTMGTGANGLTAESTPISFYGVRFIRFGNFVSHRITGDWSGGIGLSEVRFFGAPPPRGTVISIK